MIVSRTPFRVSLFGGGSDYPSYLGLGKGMVVGGAINKYCYLTARFPDQGFGWKYRVRYSFSESATAIDGISHPAVREFLREWGIEEATEINHSSDLPARSGMGSSSSFIVGLTSIFSSIRGSSISGIELAKKSIDFEQNTLRENVGFQDASFAALGGFRKISFNNSQVIEAFEEPKCSKEYLDGLANGLILVRVPIFRIASEIAQEQVKSIDKNRNLVTRLVEIAELAWGQIQRENLSFETLGQLLRQSWEIKRRQSNKIDNLEVTRVIELLKQNGSLGEKLLGAGGGGFVLSVMDPLKQREFKARFPEEMCVNFKWDYQGNRVARVFE